MTDATRGSVRLAVKDHRVVVGGHQVGVGRPAEDDLHLDEVDRRQDVTGHHHAVAHHSAVVEGMARCLSSLIGLPFCIKCLALHTGCG